jgi:hypothetical protein
MTANGGHSPIQVNSPRRRVGLPMWHPNGDVAEGTLRPGVASGPCIRHARTSFRPSRLWFGRRCRAGRTALSSLAVRGGRSTGWRGAYRRRNPRSCRARPGPAAARSWPPRHGRPPRGRSSRSPVRRQAHRPSTAMRWCARPSARPIPSASAQSARGCPSADAWLTVRSVSVEQQVQAAAAAHEHLATEKIEAMNSVCALVNGIEPIVPVELFEVAVAGVAVSTVYLDGQTVGLDHCEGQLFAIRVNTSSRSSASSRSASVEAVIVSSTRRLQYRPSARAPST